MGEQREENMCCPIVPLPCPRKSVERHAQSHSDVCRLGDQRLMPHFPLKNGTELTTREVKRLTAATANSSRLKIRIHRQTLEQLPAEDIEGERDLLTTLKNFIG